MNDVKKGGMLAFDIGAGSGRAVHGSLHGGKLVYEEVARFETYTSYLGQRSYYDVFNILHEIKVSIAACASRGMELAGIGIDTWGCTACLLDKDGDLAITPYHYRDNCADLVADDVFGRFGAYGMFAKTGFIPMTIHPAFHLSYLKKYKPWITEHAATLLMLPDFLNYALTGEVCSERTISVTSQFYDLKNRCWNKEYFSELGFDAGMLAGIVTAGSRSFALKAQVQEELNLRTAPAVVTVAGHDTASAAAFVPCTDPENFIYISCGTWSCLGCSVDEPIVNRDMFERYVTNDIMPDGRPLLRQNINGLFILQECRREWAANGYDRDWEELIAQAEQARPFAAVINTEDPRFHEAGNMKDKIMAYCRETGQSAPETPGGMCRLVLESLAFRYRAGVEDMEALSGRKFDEAHLVGGGIKNRLLCHFAAGALGRRVIVGPDEASVMGNLLLQSMGLGQCDEKEARQIVLSSAVTTVYDPQDADLWDEKYRNYCSIINCMK